MIKYKVMMWDDDWMAEYRSDFGQEYVEFKKLSKPILINWDKMRESLKLLEGAHNEVHSSD